MTSKECKSCGFEQVLARHSRKRGERLIGSLQAKEGRESISKLREFREGQTHVQARGSRGKSGHKLRMLCQAALWSLGPSEWFLQKATKDQTRVQAQNEHDSSSDIGSLI